MKPEIGITIEDALHLKQFRNAKVVAGRTGLSRVIKSVNVMEVPDIFRWVKEGELLLTTVFAIRDDIDAQRELIPTLAKHGLAGIAIKPGRYIEEIPKMMIAQADECNFPLIELPLEASFSDLMEPILSEILNAQTIFLKKSLEIHERLMDVVLHGGGLQEIITSLAIQVRNPVALLNPVLEIQAVELMNFLEQEQLFSWVEMSQTWRLKDEFQNGEWQLADNIWLEGRIKDHMVQLRGKQIKQLSIPIMVSRENYGYIYVWEMDGALETGDLISIERSVTVAAMEILNQQNIFEVERRYRSDLLHDLLNGRYESEEIIISRGKTLNWDLNQTFSVIVFELWRFDQQSLSRQDHLNLNRLLWSVNNYIENRPEQILFAEWGNRLVLLHALPKSKSYNEFDQFRSYLTKTIMEINELITQYQQKCHIGVSSLSKGISRLKQCYKEAKEAVRVAKLINSAEEAIYYEKLGIYRLLHKINPNDLKHFLNDNLGQLIEYDQSHNTELVETLDVYFQCNGNLREMARNLFVHYNTVLYRLERIQKILHLDLNDRNSRLNLEVALKIVHTLNLS